MWVKSVEQGLWSEKTGDGPADEQHWNLEPGPAPCESDLPDFLYCVVFYMLMPAFVLIEN